MSGGSQAPGRSLKKLGRFSYERPGYMAYEAYIPCCEVNLTCSLCSFCCVLQFHVLCFLCNSELQSNGMGLKVGGAITGILVLENFGPPDQNFRWKIWSAS